MTTAVGHRPVTLLSVGYEELGCVSLKKAARLLTLDKAVVEEADPSGRFLRHWPWPLVIRLKNHIKMARDKLYAKATLTKRGIMLRDGRKCAYCNSHASTVDHVMPKSRGGDHSWLNLVAACVKCNNKKDNRTPDEAGMKLLFQPAIPTKMELRLKAR